MVQSPLFRLKLILHFIWKSRSQSLEEEWRGTESMLLEVQCDVSTVSDGLGCRVICWCWSIVFFQVHNQRSSLPWNFGALYASVCWIFMEMLISFSSRTLAAAHTAKPQVVCWPWYYCAWLASRHAWPEPHLESMGYFQEKDEKQWL